jgi:hypothetical protein
MHLVKNKQESKTCRRVWSRYRFRPFIRSGYMAGKGRTPVLHKTSICTMDLKSVILFTTDLASGSHIRYKASCYKTHKRLNQIQMKHTESSNTKWITAGLKQVLMQDLLIWWVSTERALKWQMWWSQLGTTTIQTSGTGTGTTTIQRS